MPHATGMSFSKYVEVCGIIFHLKVYHDLLLDPDTSILIIQLPDHEVCHYFTFPNDDDDDHS